MNVRIKITKETVIEEQKLVHEFNSCYANIVGNTSGREFHQKK